MPPAMASLLVPRISCLRPLAAPPRSAPALVSAAFTTSAAQPSKHPRSQQAWTQRKIRFTSPLTHGTRLSRRPNSSSSQQPQQQQQQQQQKVPDHILTWNRFFDLRRKRRWINLGCSVLTAIGTVGVVAPMLAEQDFDTWGAQISGLDPIIVLGISTFAIAAGGWLMGPTVGNLGFGMWASRRGWKTGIAEKEKSFYARIKRYRADASASSPQNPIPDYYGEKIGSVQAYRRWLKDQKAFNLKKNKNML
ncbi:Presequence translocated-associated motor subunit PAM17 [Cercospora zeina]